jgi:hypothetical protein
MKKALLDLQGHVTLTDPAQVLKNSIPDSILIKLWDEVKGVVLRLLTKIPKIVAV